MDDARFKADVMKDLVAKYDRIWLFENEPVNINLILSETPSVALSISTQLIAKEEVPANLERITRF